MNWVLLLASIPMLWRLLSPMVPPHYLEPYAYWSAATLNSADKDGRVPGWRNMGYWTEKDETYSHANAALAQKLLDFSGTKKGGHVLDMAHGTGESLLLFLEQGCNVDALTSLATETAEAQQLVYNWTKTTGKEADVTWYTTSAAYRPTKDFKHPLNPMRGYMGEGSSETIVEDGSGQVVLGEQVEGSAPGPYDLIYVLDAAYHFPPSIGYFAATTFPVLREGGGVLAYTDVIPPPSLSRFPMMLLGGMMAPFLGTPVANLNRRPATLDEYKATLERIGFTDVKIEDWTSNVFKPLADNVEKKGGFWAMYAKVLRLVDSSGWKFVAVRGVRPQGSRK